MKFLVALGLLVAVAVAAPPASGADKDAVVLRQESSNIGVGDWSDAYETSNGIAAQSQGTLKNAGTENEAIEVRGQYSYIGDDGVNYVVTYVSNEGGFQPSGAHIPV